MRLDRKLAYPWGYAMMARMDKKTHAQLSAHIARIEGQLAAARIAVESNDCNKVAKTLLAASRSLTSVRATCISEFMSQRVYSDAKVRDTGLLEDVQRLMRA